MKEKTNSTRKFFKLYKDECLKYIGRMGLPYTIRFSLDKGESPYMLGACGSTPHARDAIIRLNRDWTPEYPLNKRTISGLALHEAMELALAEYREFAMCRFVSEDEEEKIRHGVIANVHNLVFGREIR